MKNITNIALVAAIIIVVSILSNQFFFRLDVTDDNRYTLSKATKDILKNLENPVTVTAYFTEDLPQGIASVKNEFRDMLVEYANLSGGMVDFEFISPNEDETIEQEILQKGIQPRIINVREKDQSKQLKAYLGAIISLGDQEDIMPFIMPGSSMEYDLSTGIKKLSVVDKPSVGLIQGHGEPSLQELSQVYQSLSILYNVENIDLSTETEIGDRFKAIALLRPTDSIPPIHFQKLDGFLAKGGKLLVAANAVNGDFSNQQGTASTTGVEGWLLQKGLEIEASFVTDASSGQIQIRQQLGPFTMPSNIDFYYYPKVISFSEHPATKGLEQVILPFASPVRFVGDSTKTYTSIVSSSQNAGIERPPVFFNVGNRQWTRNDFPLSGVSMGGVLEGKLAGDVNSTIVVFGDGDFPISGQTGTYPDNVSLFVNVIDWLSDDTGLIDLRTKGVNNRPIDELEDGKRSMLKYLNFGLPIVLILIYAIIRFQRQQRTRLKRKAERYA